MCAKYFDTERDQKHFQHLALSHGPSSPLEITFKQNYKEKRGMTGVFFPSKKLIDWYVIHFHASVFDAASILCSFNRHAKKAETLIYEFIKALNEFYDTDIYYPRCPVSLA